MNFCSSKPQRAFSLVHIVGLWPQRSKVQVRRVLKCVMIAGQSSTKIIQQPPSFDIQAVAHVWERCCFHQHHKVSTQRRFEFASHLTNQIPGSLRSSIEIAELFFCQMDILKKRNPNNPIRQKCILDEAQWAATHHCSSGIFIAIRRQGNSVVVQPLYHFDQF